MFSQSTAKDLAPIACSAKELAEALQKTLQYCVSDLRRVHAEVSVPSPDSSFGSKQYLNFIENLAVLPGFDPREPMQMSVYAWRGGEPEVFLTITMKSHRSGLDLQVACYDTLCERSVLTQLTEIFPPKPVAAPDVLPEPAVAWPEPGAPSKPDALPEPVTASDSDIKPVLVEQETAVPVATSTRAASVSAPTPAAEVVEEPAAPWPVFLAILPMALVGVAAALVALAFPEASAYAGQILEWPLLFAAAGLVLAGGIVLWLRRFRRVGRAGAVVRTLSVALLAVAAIGIVGYHWIDRTFTSSGFGPWADNIYHPVEGSTAKVWVRDYEKDLELRGGLDPTAAHAVKASDASGTVSWGDYGLTPERVHQAVIDEREHRLGGLALRYESLSPAAKERIHPFFLLHFLACLAIVLGAAVVFFLALRRGCSRLCRGRGTAAV